MPYTNERTSNTIEDKNTIKSRTYFHPECVIINKEIYRFFFSRYEPKSNVHRTVRPVPQNFGKNTHIVTPIIVIIIVWTMQVRFETC